MKTDKSELDDNAGKNEDKQLWQESDDAGHRSVHVTKDGGIGINVGGTVYVKPLKEWHKLAAEKSAMEKAHDKDFVPCKCEHIYCDGSCHQICPECNPEKLPCPLEKAQGQKQQYKGLREKLEQLINNDYTIDQISNPCEIDKLWRDQITDILSHHPQSIKAKKQPAPASLVSEINEWQKKAWPKPLDNDWVDFDKILSAYHPNKKPTADKELVFLPEGTFTVGEDGFVETKYGKGVLMLSRNTRTRPRQEQGE